MLFVCLLPAFPSFFSSSSPSFLLLLPLLLFLLFLQNYVEGLPYEAWHRRRGGGGAAGPQSGPDGKRPAFPEAAPQPCREHHEDVPDSVGTLGADPTAMASRPHPGRQVLRLERTNLGSHTTCDLQEENKAGFESQHFQKCLSQAVLG